MSEFDPLDMYAADCPECGATEILTETKLGTVDDGALHPCECGYLFDGSEQWLLYGKLQDGVIV